ncbi:MAG: hypothetical protein K6E62_04810 [Lachnospiraceae bacterium]|nr:hypothetical protein [Lachnospiraceae bacterium]
MRYFFIDLENVRNEGLEGVLSLNEKDMVYIFYSENAFSMAIPTMESITNSRCSSKFIKTNYIGKNAMDFQIVSLFGAMIERCKEGSFYIISKDNGFRSAVSFCESFFSEYPIKCGVYPRIITAIAAESKDKEKDNSGESGKEKRSRSRRSRKKSGKHDQNENQNVAAGVFAEESPDRQISEDHTSEYDENAEITTNSTINDADTSDRIDSKTEEKTGKTGRKRSRNRKDRSGDNENVNNNQDTASAGGVVKDNTGNPDRKENNAGKGNKTGKADKTGEDTTAGEASGVSGTAVTSGVSGVSDEAENGTHGRLDYIFRLLGEYLSEKTIEIYAGYIDEGISKTSNRDELQTYFRENLGDDEGEALFKVIRSDYEKYKQSRPRKTSRSRHRRSGKSARNKEKEAD